MREIEIQRMNFVARGGLVLDYQHIAIFVALWILLLVTITGIEYFRLWFGRYNVERSRTVLTALMKDHERRLAMLELSGPKIDHEKQQDLIAVFRTPPCWSCLMNEVQEKILPSVRIVAIRTTEDKETGKFAMHIEGEAPSMRMVVEFMRRLQTSSMFREVVMSQAKRNVSGSFVNYTLDAQVLILK